VFSPANPVVCKFLAYEPLYIKEFAMSTTRKRVLTPN